MDVVEFHASIDEVLGQIDVADAIEHYGVGEVLDKINLREIVENVDQGELLSIIGEGNAKAYWGLKSEGEE